MRQRVKGRKLNRTSSHRRAMFRNMLTSLFEHKRIHTTEAKAKELRPIAEKVITRAVKAVRRETQGLLSDGAKHDINTRRLIGSYLMNKSVVDILFDEIVQEVGERQGGYTRVVKTGIRRGDAGRAALIELVDYNTEVDESSTKKKKKSKPSSPKAKSETKPEAIEENIEEVAQTVDEDISEVEVVPSDIVEETPAQDSEESSEEEATDSGVTDKSGTNKSGNDDKEEKSDKSE
jgi:large subunit ribosomal protein L17